MKLLVLLMLGWMQVQGNPGDCFRMNSSRMLEKIECPKAREIGKDASYVKAVPARYELKDNGLLEPVPCNPPLDDKAKSAGLACMERSKYWTIVCDDPSTVTILPQVDRPAFYDFGAAKDRGEKFWCISIETTMR